MASLFFLFFFCFFRILPLTADDLKKPMENIPDTLMLSAEEKEKFAETITKKKKEKEPQPYTEDDELSCFYCNGFMYMSPDKWTIWLNDHMHENKEVNGLDITNVTADGIEIRIDQSADKYVHLKTDQTYCIGKPFIMSGDCRE
jgi:hypothetical protein